MIREDLFKTRNELLGEKLEESKEQIKQILEDLLDENFLVKELETEILIKKIESKGYYAIVKGKQELVNGLSKDLMKEYMTKLISILFDEGIWCEELVGPDMWKVRLTVTL